MSWELIFKDLTMKTKRCRRLRLFLIPALLPLIATATVAGPPLICHSFDIGSAKSLPWVSHNWNLSGTENYDTSKLVSDTLTILSAEKAVIVHMETLRRATLYARKDPAAAKELLTRITMGTKSITQQSNESRALTYFDTGYLAETYKQWLGDSHNPATGLDGLALIKQAIQLRGNDPQMELAAALVTLSGSGHASEHQAHAQKAIAGAKTDPLLARNLASHFTGDQGQTIAEMLTKTTGAEPKP
jgi:hypothetical protein